MKTLLFFTLFFSTLLNAISLDELLENSLLKNPSLETIHVRITANKQSANIAKTFANPELFLTTNTLDSSEAMSQTILTLKQKISYYSKRDKNQNVALAEEEILKEKLRFAKIALVEQIKNEAYNFWELQELTNITNEYITLTEQNIELYESYTSVSENQHMGIMKAQLSLSELKIQKSKLNAQIVSAYARLSYLSAFEVKDLEISLSMGDKPVFQSLENSLANNSTLAIKEKELQKQNAKVEVAAINNYPDINLLVGYSHREKFDDYLNIGVGLTLPIYSTEDAKEKEQRLLSLAYKTELENVKNSINATLKVYYAQMTSAYETYHIVQDDSLPQLTHMFELSNSSISTGAELFLYVDLLFDKLALEKKSINAVASFNKANAKISQLSGEIN